MKKMSKSSVGMFLVAAFALTQVGLASANCTSPKVSTAAGFISCSGGGESGEIRVVSGGLRANLFVGRSALGQLFNASNNRVFCSGTGQVRTPLDRVQGSNVGPDATKQCPLAFTMRVRVN